VRGVTSCFRLAPCRRLPLAFAGAGKWLASLFKTHGFWPQDDKQGLVSLTSSRNPDLDSGNPQAYGE